MKNLRSQKKSTLNTIESNWPRLEPSSHVACLLSQNSDVDVELNEFRKAFINKNWWEISERIFESSFPEPFLIENLPFGYYLPAFLRAAILLNAIPSVRERVIDRLTPPKKTKNRILFEETFSYYSQIQKGIVREFLDYMTAIYRHKDTEENNRIVQRIAYAIEDYWGCTCPRVLPEHENAGFWAENGRH